MRNNRLILLYESRMYYFSLKGDYLGWDNIRFAERYTKRVLTHCKYLTRLQFIKYTKLLEADIIGYIKEMII